MAGNLEEEEESFAMGDSAQAQRHPPPSKRARFPVAEPAAEEKESPAMEDEEEPGAVENPRPTNNKYDRIAPYLRKWDPEKPEEIDEAIYYFTDEDVEDEIPPGKLDRMRNSVKRYFKQVQESGGKGYDVDCIPPSCVGSPFIPRSLDDKPFYNRALGVAKFAIDRINSETIVKFRKYYEFVSIEKVVETRTLSMLLTFKAKELDAAAGANANAPVKTLQATVWSPPFDEFVFKEWRFKP